MGIETMLVKYLIIPVMTFIVITWWMVNIGVDPTVSAIIGGAAVFGELVFIVKIIR